MEIHRILLVVAALGAAAALSACAPEAADVAKPAPQGRAAAPAAEGAAAAARPQTTCPIMGGAVNKALYVDAEGFRIYVCCQGCLAKVQADPKASLAAVRAAGQTPEPAPAPAP